MRQAIKKALILIKNRCYSKRLAKQKLSYSGWARLQEKQKLAGKRAKREEFVLWVLNGGSMHRNAVKWIEEFFYANSKAMFLYGDEDVMDEVGERSNPWVKPCWSPDTYQSYFYLGSVIAIRKELLQKAGLSEERDIVEFSHPDEIREVMDKLVEVAGGFQKGERDAIQRVPRVLYHVSDAKQWEVHFESAFSKESGSVSLGLEQAKAENGAVKMQDKVSVIIPSKDNPVILKQCVDSLRKVADSAEIIVVDNGSSPENRELVKELVGEENYLYQPMEFNFARMCNMGAKKAIGELLLFLNDDIEVLDTDWYQIMCEKSKEAYVGAVGLKLYYPDSTTIQHAGVVNLPVGPDHKLHGMDDKNECYFKWNRYQQNRLAVTAACLMIEMKKFEEIVGFCEELQVNYNDVDLCMKLYEAGYHNVVLNDYYAYHHESLSRGNNENPRKTKQIQEERSLLYERHPALGDTDPYFPKELDRYGLNTRILPAYQYASFRLQEPSWKPYAGWQEIREEECLMNRVEICDCYKMQGYGIVLWDNNACYEKELLLCPEKEQELDFEREAYSMKVNGVYRYELEENVPDQVNVALCGYCISRKGEGLPKGKYRVGMIATNKISGTKFRSFSGTSLTVD